MEFETPRQSFITAENDAVGHLSITTNSVDYWNTTEFPDQHKSLLEEARDAKLKLSCFIKEEKEKEMS